MRHALSICARAIAVAIAPLLVGNPALSEHLVANRLSSDHPVASSGVALAQDGPPFDVVLYSDSFTVRSAPGSIVTAELLDSDDMKKDEGVGFAGPDGRAQVGFFIGGALVEPGDTIRVSQAGGAPLEAHVPSLTAAADVDAEKVTGVSIPDDAVTISLRLADGSTVERRVMTASDGTFSLDLSSAVDLEPGAFEGTVRVETAEMRTSALLVALSMDVTLGASSVVGTAPPGSTVSLMRAVAGGSDEFEGAAMVRNGTRFEIDLANQTVPLAPGDRLTLALGEDSLVANLSRAEVVIDSSTDTVTGVAGSDVELAIALDNMDGESSELSTVTGPNGGFAIDLAGLVDLGPGWRVRVRHRAERGVTIGALGVLPKVRIGVRQPMTFGRAAPGSPVTATLVTASDQVKAVRPTRANANGEYVIPFGFGGFPGAPPPVQPEPGDILELAFVTGDPILYQIPDLTAQSDGESDAVRGNAPTDAEVRAVVTTDPTAPTATAIGQADSTYMASFPDYDLVAPANGQVIATLSNGHEFYTAWAAVQMNYVLGSNIQPSYVVGNAPAGSVVSIELLDAEGRVVGTGQSPVFGGEVVIVAGAGPASPQFFTDITDVTGAQVMIRPGDTLRLMAGLETVETEVPPLDAIILVGANTLTGRTAPNVPVEILVSQDGSTFAPGASVTSDDAGAFSHDFSGELELKHGDLFLLSAVVDGHVVQSIAIAPGLLLDLDQAVLLGSVSEPSDVAVRVTRSDLTVAQLAASVDDSGEFFALLASGGGQRLILQPGDVITATPSNPELDTLTLTVPHLDIDWDEDADRLFGRATPDGSLTLLATDAYARFDSLGVAQAWPAIEGIGEFESSFVPSVDVRPGTQVIALYRPAEGHYVVRTRTVPILNAEHTGSQACGFADPRSSVAVSLRSGAAAARGSGSFPARFDGYFAGIVRDVQGNPLASQADETLSAALGRRDAELTLPPLDVSMDWAQGILQLSGPPQTMVFISPAIPCDEQHEPGILEIQVGGFGLATFTDEDGNLQEFVPPFLTQSVAGLEVALFDPAAGDRVFRHVYQLRGRVFVETDRVGGQANPLEAVDATLLAADGGEKGRGQATARPDGGFDLSLVGADASTAVIEPGDVVRLEAGGSGAEIPVEALSFDWSPGQGILVNAPASRAVQLQLRMVWGQVLSVQLGTDETGRASFEEVDVPVRGGWSLDDIGAVRVVLPVAGGHEIISQSPGFEQAPERGGATIFLPAVATPGGGAEGSSVAEGAMNAESGTYGEISGESQTLDRVRWLGLRESLDRQMARQPRWQPGGSVEDAGIMVGLTTASKHAMPLEYSSPLLPWMEPRQ